MIQAVIFDMDGVIVDSERHWPSSEGMFYRELIPELTDEDMHRFVGLSIFSMYKEFVGVYGIQMSQEEFLSRYKAMAKIVYLQKASILPGFFELISFIKEKSLPTGLASSSPRSWIQMAIDRFSLQTIFDVVISAEDLNGEGKPSPKIYMETAKQLHVHPKDCIAIEDSKNGISSAKNAGMVAIGLRNGFNERQDLSQADILIKHLSEVSEIIESFTL